MTVFTWAAIFVVIILCALSAYATVAIGKHIDARDSELDTSVDPAIKQHPFLLNPIIMMYIVVGIFMTIVIFFYHAASQ